jgi:hypothetical protein
MQHSILLLFLSSTGLKKNAFTKVSKFLFIDLIIQFFPPKECGRPKKADSISKQNAETDQEHVKPPFPQKSQANSSNVDAVAENCGSQVNGQLRLFQMLFYFL